MTNVEIDPVVLISLQVETKHSTFDEQHQPIISYLRWRLNHLLRPHELQNCTSLLPLSRQRSHHPRQQRRPQGLRAVIRLKTSSPWDVNRRYILRKIVLVRLKR